MSSQFCLCRLSLLLFFHSVSLHLFSSLNSGFFIFYLSHMSVFRFSYFAVQNARVSLLSAFRRFRCMSNKYDALYGDALMHATHPLYGGIECHWQNRGEWRSQLGLDQFLPLRLELGDFGNVPGARAVDKCGNDSVIVKFWGAREWRVHRIETHFFCASSFEMEPRAFQADHLACSIIFIRLGALVVHLPSEICLNKA